MAAAPPGPPGPPPPPRVRGVVWAVGSPSGKKQNLFNSKSRHFGQPDGSRGPRATALRPVSGTGVGHWYPGTSLGVPWTCPRVSGAPGDLESGSGVTLTPISETIPHCIPHLCSRCQKPARQENSGAAAMTRCALLFAQLSRFPIVVPDLAEGFATL